MQETIIYDANHKPDDEKKQRIIDFLHTHLEEYGDAKNDIRKAINYALKETDSFGGFVISLEKEHAIRGVVVINRTGMGGYIPENILVYIATHTAHRGEGLGKQLMTTAITHTDGDIALHVEPNNPAIRLYRKYGFESPYLEMRLYKKDS